MGVFCGGTSSISLTGNALAPNSSNTILNNTISKQQYGVYIIGTSTTTLDATNNISSNLVGTAAVGDGFSLEAIRVTNQSAITISGNDVQNVKGTGSTNMFGIRCVDIKNSILSRNIVHNMNYSGASTTKMFAIAVTGSTFNTVGNPSLNTTSNNWVYDITSNCTSAVWCATGMVASGGYGDKFYYNSVSLTGQLNNSTSGLVAAFANGDGTLSTVTSNIDVRNNIFSLTGSSGTGGNVWAYYTAATALAGSTLNYNDLYCAGTGATNNVGRFNGISYSTLGAWQTATSQEANSINRNPNFTSTTDLHINTSLTSFLESAGTPIAGITVDYDGDTRNATTPDIGADEGTFIAPILNDMDATAFIDPTNGGSKITGVAFAPQASFTNQGVNTQTNVTVRYRIVNSGLVEVYNQTATIASISSGATTTVTFPSTTLSIAGTYTIFAKAELAGDAVSANDQITGSITVEAPLCGTYTIGNSQPVGYKNLTQAIGKINGLGASCAVTFELAADYSSSPAETFPITFVAYPGASATNTLRIKPASGVTASIAGSVASGALIQLSGADFVTIDGSNSGGTDRSLTITNSATLAPTAVSIVSLGTALGATDNTIKNCNITTGTQTSIGYGISVGGSTPGTTGADNDNVTIQNNSITKCTVGIYASGTASASAGGDDNLNITGNTIDYNSTLASSGIRVGNATGSSISQNTISEQTSSSQAPTAISLETGFVSSSVTRNTITKSVTTNTGGYGGRGITVGTGTASSALTIANNVVYGVNGFDYSSFTNSASMGIVIGAIGNSSTLSTTAGGINLYYNSVSMSGTSGYAAAYQTAALYVGSGASALDIRNNILSNSINNTTSTTGSKNYGIYSAASNTAYTTINYNDYYGVTQSNSTGFPGYLAGDLAVLSDLQTAFGQNGNSITADPLFTPTSVNITNALRPNTGSPVINTGVAVSVTTDYLGTTRSGNTSMGAYETATPTCAALAAPTSLVFGAVGPGTIAGSYTATPGAAGYLVVRYVNPTAATAPTLGTGYAVGDAIGAGTVVAFTTLTTFTAIGLTPNTNYDFYVYAINLTNCNGPSYSAAPLTGSQATSACPGLATTIHVGSSQTYTNLTNLAPILNGCPVVGNTTVFLDADYVSTSEIYPIVFNANPNTNNYIITVTANAGVSGLVVSGSTTGTSPLIDLSGAKNYIFDGRSNGTTNNGAANLQITNTGAGPAIRLFSDAQNNTLRYLNLKSSNTSATNGVVRITSALGSVITSGNNNNTIDNCSIDGNGVSPNGIYASGSAAPADNKSNTISNCKIFNNYSDVAGVSNYGILIGSNNGVSASSAWTISGNSFYQTAARTYNNATSASFISAIGGGFIPGGAHNITGNFIGGTAANAGGSAMTLTGTGAYLFSPINLITGGASASIVSGNTIANISVTTASVATTGNAAIAVQPTVATKIGRAHV